MYDPEYMDQVLPPAPPRASAKNGEAIIVELPDDLPRVDVDSLPVGEQTRRLIRLGREAAPEHYPDRSSALWRAEHDMLDAGMDLPTIAAVLLDPENGISEKPRTMGRDWLADELARAQAKHTTPLLPMNGHANGHTNGSGNGHAAAAALADAVPIVDGAGAAELAYLRGRVAELEAENARLQTENAELKRLHSGMVSVLEVPTEQLRPAEKLVAIAATCEVVSAESRAPGEPHRLYRAAIAARTGLSEATVGDTLQRLSAEGGPFERHESYEKINTKTGEVFDVPRRVLDYAPKYKTVGETLRAVATYTPPRKDKLTWGGKRVQVEELLAIRCPEHPLGGTTVNCGLCKKHLAELAPPGPLVDFSDPPSGQDAPMGNAHPVNGSLQGQDAPMGDAGAFRAPPCYVCGGTMRRLNPGSEPVCLTCHPPPKTVPRPWSPRGSAWEPIPPGAVLVNGLEIRATFGGGQEARWPTPAADGDEELI